MQLTDDEIILSAKKIACTNCKYQSGCAYGDLSLPVRLCSNPPANMDCNIRYYWEGYRFAQELEEKEKENMKW